MATYEEKVRSLPITRSLAPAHVGRQLLGLLARMAQAIRNRYYEIDISDEYTDWLCSANAGWLKKGNLYCFDYAIRHIPSQAPIVEIGSFCGLSTNAITYYKERHGVRNALITCDKWEFATSGMVGNSSIPRTEYCDFVKETYQRNVLMFSRYDLPYALEMWSDDFFAAWRAGREVTDVFGKQIRLGGPISFCYIDGGHDYDQVRRDFENCDEFLEPGGFLLFDDSADLAPWPDVHRVATEVRRSGQYELVIKNPNYFFRKKA